MEHHTCDLCSLPIKDFQMYTLLIVPPGPLSTSVTDLQDYSNRAAKEKEREICSTCKYLLDRIFFHRLEGMNILTTECHKLFNLPSYEKEIIPKKDNKKGKK